MSSAGVPAVAAVPAVPAAVVAAAIPAAAASWFSGYDADTQGHIQNRGWDKLSVDQALAQAVKAHREAEKLIGIPAEQLLRSPKDANDAENLGRIYDKLGVPKDAKDYDFSTVKSANGEVLDAETTEFVRGLATKLHLSKDGATELAKALDGLGTGAETQELAEYNAKLTSEKEQLNKDWGQYAAQNKIAAQNAFAKVVSALGLTKEQSDTAMAAMEKSLGFGTVLKIFNAFGTKLGEDTFVNNQQGQQGQVMTKESAKAKLDMNMKDEAWVKKYESGDVLATAEFQNLTRMMTGV
jgi:hypothetical protein